MPPRRQRPEVPRDLETICLKCLEKEPRRRYRRRRRLWPTTCGGSSTAGRSRRGRSGRWDVSWRWCRRNPDPGRDRRRAAPDLPLGTPTLRASGSRPAPIARAEIERDRAERSRDRAVGAVDLLLRTEDEVMLSEELRPYRKALIDAGMRESLALVGDLEGDPRAEIQRLEAYEVAGSRPAGRRRRDRGRRDDRARRSRWPRPVARDPTSLLPSPTGRRACQRLPRSCRMTASSRESRRSTRSCGRSRAGGRHRRQP